MKYPVLLLLNLLALNSYAWVGEFSYHTQNGYVLRYLVSAPKAPEQLKEKVPVIIFQEGEVSHPAPEQAFEPNQRKAQMEQFSQMSGLIFAVPELRRHQLALSPSSFCQLDFFHRLSDLSDFIAEVKALSFVDTSNMFLVGHSAGSETSTLTAVGRTDVRGVVTLAGSVISCDEEDLKCTMSIEQTYQMTCQPKVIAQEGRHGKWWRELFFESQMFRNITRTSVPYLALVGELEETEPSHQGPITQFNKYGPILKSRNPNFAFEILPGLGHNDILGSQMAWGKVFTFIGNNVIH